MDIAASRHFQILLKIRYCYEDSEIAPDELDESVRELSELRSA